MEAFTYATQKTAAFYDSQKRLATEHAVFKDAGTANRCAKPATARRQLLSSFTLLRLGTSPQAANDPAKRALLDQKDDLEQKIDTLKYQKAAMDPADYKTAADRCAGRTRESAGGVGQMNDALAPIFALSAGSALRSCALQSSCGLLDAAQAWSTRQGPGLL